MRALLAKWAFQISYENCNLLSCKSPEFWSRPFAIIKVPLDFGIISFVIRLLNYLQEYKPHSVNN